MKNVVALLMLIFSYVMIAKAQESEQTGKKDYEHFEMPEENGTEVFEPANSRKWWKQRDDEYVHTPDFKLQVARTQLAVGSLLLPSGLSMIAVGASKLNTGEGTAPTAEIAGSTNSQTKKGRGFIIGGTITSVSGIFLIFRGHDSLMQWKNANGQVVKELGLPQSGDLGVSLKF